ncbi:hypothetical protein J1N35_018636 [Gossypium stocksii]|uniref:Uncharacterized protein n=1 Tax=Gossypium stocksii TaxID=47602 RepID=A0A9D3VPH7_9ROSI|nr:hypothetical protein J1N35_018636 [Gossypium stocksii]
MGPHRPHGRVAHTPKLALPVWITRPGLKVHMPVWPTRPHSGHHTVVSSTRPGFRQTHGCVIVHGLPHG